MAIDKSRTSKGMKVGVIILVVAFVLGIGGTLTTLTTTGGTPAQTGTATSTAGGDLQQISQTALAGITPNETALKDKPKDYALLKTLGDQYFDYAQQVRQTAPSAGIDVTIWQRATDYYRQALAVQDGDPAVRTDMAISQFYGNDVNGAIKTIEPVLKNSPKFAQGQYNGGIFYQAAGDNAKAKAAYEAYLKLEPNGESAANAKQFLSQLQNTGASQVPAPTGSTTTAP